MSVVNQAPNLEEVVQKLAPGAVLVRAWRLEGGISAAMTGLELRETNGRLRKLVVRQPMHGDRRRNLEAARAEYRLLAALGQASIAAPSPLMMSAPDGAGPEPYLVLEFVTGKVAFAPVDLDSTLRQAADQLAAIHRVDIAGLSFLPAADGRCPELDREPKPGRSYSLNALPIKELLAAHGPPASGNAAALLHGDYWPGNLIWRDGQLAAVVDWEDALLGDPLIDLAIARLELAWIFSLEAMERFTACYQAQMPIDYVALPYWDLCAALRLARLVGDDLPGWVSFFEPYGRQEIDEDRVRVVYDDFVVQARARVKVEG